MDVGITVFVPAYNEVANLQGAVEDVLAATAGLRGYEVIIVDDGSTDGTGELADRLARTLPGVRVIHQPTNLGLAAGYKTALAAARMPFFTFVPGDREVSAASIGLILSAVGSADVVVPYHANPGARPWYRRLLTRGSTALMNGLFGQKLRYYQGPCVYPTAVARSLPTSTRGFFFLAEMLIQALRRGCSFVEVGLIHQERAHGRSKAVTVRNAARALTMVVRLWWRFRLAPRATTDKETRA